MSTMTSVPDYHLGIRSEDICTPGTPNKQSGELISVGLEEGYLDLALVKELYSGVRDKEKEMELMATLKRCGFDSNVMNESCLALLFGANVSDNRMLYLLFPPKVFR